MKWVQIVFACVVLSASCAPIQSHQSKTIVPTNGGGMTAWQKTLKTEVEPQWKTEKDRSFDFWVGIWEANWRSKPPEEFHFQPEGAWTKQYVFPVLGGKAVMELAEQRDLDPTKAAGTGFSVRYYDHEKDRWVMAQHWPSPGFPGIGFMDQLIGISGHGRHEFYSHLSRPNAQGGYDHRRYVFSDIKHESFRWDGSNSSDEGATWTTWNIVEFHRIGGEPTLETRSLDLPTYHNGLMCADDDTHKGLDALIGEWVGEVTFANGRAEPAKFKAGRIADGCGLIGVITIPGRDYSLLNGWAYTKYFDRWINFRLDNQEGTRHEYRVAAADTPDSFSLINALRIEDEHEQIFIGDNLALSDATKRTNIDVTEDGSLEIREQVRLNSSDEWMDDRTYRFTRAE